MYNALFKFGVNVITYVMIFKVNENIMAYLISSNDIVIAAAPEATTSAVIAAVA